MASTAGTSGRGHPIRSAAAQIDDILKTVRDAPAWSLSPAEAREAMVELTRLEAQIAELQPGSATTGRPWRWKPTPVPPRRRTGGRTPPSRPVPRRTARPGSPRRRVGGVRAGPGGAGGGSAAGRPGPGDRGGGRGAARRPRPTRSRRMRRRRLVGYAVHHDARELRILGNRILEVIAPEVGEAHEAQQSAAEEREAEAAASFRMVEDGHGKCHGRFTISALHGAMLKKQLLAIAAPKHRARRRRGTRTRTPVRTPAGGGVRGVHRDLPHRPTPACRWRLGHGGGHHDRGHPDGRVEGRGAGHRPADQPRPGPEAGVSGRDHPRRPRHPVPGPRPRPEDPVPHRTPADRPGPGAARLHRGGLRLAARYVPRPPRPAVQQPAAPRR